MEQRLSGHDLSYDPAPVEDDEYSPSAYLPSPDGDPADLVESADWALDTRDRLGEALDDLDERSRSIIERRWLTDKKSTLHELADDYGVSAERIRQIEASAIGKLKALMVS